MIDADLRFADLRAADLADADLSGAKLARGPLDPREHDISAREVSASEVGRRLVTAAVTGRFACRQAAPPRASGESTGDAPRPAGARRRAAPRSALGHAFPVRGSRRRDGV
jgi:hypothetical protein